jgi:DNA-binding NarL/FixJ family response regulator
VLPLTVLLAEDHALVRAGVRSLLSDLPGVEVIGEAVNGRQAVRLVGRLRPRVVLMDITMAELNGLDATERIRRRYPATSVIILSMHTSQAYVRRAREAGAAGYVPKDSGRAELEQALFAVAEGGTYVSPAVEQSSPDTGPSVQLTPRQREILQMIAEGHSTRAMAARLQLSTKTVETHRSKLMGRLGIHTIAGLVRYALDTGITPPGH